MASRKDCIVEVSQISAISRLVLCSLQVVVDVPARGDDASVVREHPHALIS